MAPLLALVVLAVVVALWQQPWSGSDDDRAVLATTDVQAELTTQFARLSAATTRADFAAAAGSDPDAETFAADAWQARETLNIGDASLRYVSGGDTAEFDNGDTVARVDVSWEVGATADTGGADSDETDSATVMARLRPADAGTFSLVSVAARDGQLPIWLAGAIEVDRIADATVVRIDGGDPEVDVGALASTAREQVGDVVRTQDAPLTVVSAPSESVAASLLGQQSEAVGQIAAVSTIFDIRHGDVAGPVVVLNPAVFDTMDQRAAQIVMTHEATHVLTDAVGSSADTWVVEGFADFVALRDDPAPLSVSAGQVLGGVRTNGAPDQLPTTADFSGTAYGLGGVYESAWLAFRMLGEQFSDAEVIDFYRAVRDGASTNDAAVSTLGIDAAQITERWRDYLMNIASTVS
ncbi:hypothetical protein [Aeromicrobium sp. CF3.5]|uniref:hypothetical protein n=1 Tax=Aeromicrobium sp. CF3.5 TaxID=3373078 RepID=UPI003EE75B82